MTAPSNANTSGLEVVAWMRLTKGQITHLTHLKQPGYVPLVTAASAQARIAELEADLSKVIAQRDSHWEEYIAERQSRMEHGAREAGYLDTIPKLTNRATAAEARADRLAKALEAARGTLDAIDCPLTTDRTVAGAAKHAVKRIDATLQQETRT